ncbi:hypothetical protein A2U01_0008467 [Trifolium medium]|uniref:Uncharacterized protein n=1 Tax=Trifolium medium TaxID=97028 RepID=A0A392MMT4_9FABA|nr:hypothetical protein [Trifolium medium]
MRRRNSTELFTQARASRSLLGVLPTFFSFSCGHATNGKWSSPQVGRFVYKFKPKVQSNAMGLLFRVRKLLIHSPECEIICQSRWTKPEPTNSTFKGVPIPLLCLIQKANSSTSSFTEKPLVPLSLFIRSWCNGSKCANDMTELSAGA